MKKNPAFATPSPHTHPMLLLNPLPWKVIFHAIYPDLSVALQEVQVIATLDKAILLQFMAYIKMIPIWDRRGHDRMVVGFTTTCVISAYHGVILVRIHLITGIIKHWGNCCFNNYSLSPLKHIYNTEKFSNTNPTKDLIWTRELVLLLVYYTIIWNGNRIIHQYM
jgi:hypothetical protein